MAKNAFGDEIIEDTGGKRNAFGDLVIDDAPKNYALGVDNPAKQLMEGVEAKKTPLGFVGNIFSSGANLAGNIAKLGMGAIEKPVRNVSEYVVERPIAKSEEEKMFDSAIGAPVGLLEKFASRPIAETIVGRKITPSWQEQQADAAIAGLKQRYGGIQNIKDTIYDDPVGVAMDVSMLAGGASGALRGASAVARGAELGRTAEVLGRGAEVAKTVATKTNPLTAPGRVMEATGEVAPAIKTAIQDRMFPGDPHQMAIQAIKPRASKLDFSNTLKSAMPDIKAAETKPITGVADTLDTVKAAKAANRVAYDKFRDPANQRGTVVDMSPVADSMDSNIPHDLQFEAAQGVPDAVAAVDAIKRRASAYRTQIPLVDAEKQLLAANARLDEFYAKYPRQQWKSLATNPETASIYAKAQSLRDAIYNALDNENGGAGARELQLRYGKLLEVEQELQRRKNVAARQQPQSLAQQVSKPNAAGKLALGLGQAAIGKGGIGSILSGAEGLVIKGTANWLKEQQTADALLSRAFRNYKMPQSPLPTAPKFVPRGLLESGPRRMPPGAEAPFEGRTGYPAGEWERQGRVPLQLPAATSGIGVSGVIVPDIIGRSSRGQGTPYRLLTAPTTGPTIPMGARGAIASLPPAQSVSGIGGGTEVPRFINKQVFQPKQIEAAPFDRGLPLGSPDPFRNPRSLPGDVIEGGSDSFPMSTRPSETVAPSTRKPKSTAKPEGTRGVPFGKNNPFIKKFRKPEKLEGEWVETDFTGSGPIASLRDDPLGLFNV